MKKLFGATAFAIAVFASVGCGDSYSCTESTACPTGEKIQSCCNSSNTQCEYRIGGKTFACDGTVCTTAAMRAVDECI